MITINCFLLVFLLVYVFGSVADIVIDIVNAAHLRRNGMKTPPAFKGLVDDKKLIDINSYTVDNTKISVLKNLVSIIFFLVIIISGFLPWLTNAVSGFDYIIAGLLFFAALGVITSLIDLPFDYYNVFIIEEKYGFNTRTLRIWITDIIKSVIISVILGGILLSLILAMVEYCGNLWWLWAWMVFMIFQLLVTVIYPTVIAPIFNKFTPVEDKGLEKSIREMADREGIPVEEIFQMDAGKRSRHTNAYFTGLGKSKRIVLYDTLMKAHTNDEILAVLAHEMGHLKKGHIKKQLLLVTVTSLLIFYAAAWMLKWELIYISFGFTTTPTYAGLFLIAILWGPLGFFLSPVSMALSRKFERESDKYAWKVMNGAGPLVNALKKIALDNLSNLCPHPLYVKFNYSHPPITERISSLEALK
jgi:STE24 endopeptidase